MNAHRLIVADTNVLVSAFLSPFGPPGRIIELVLAGALHLALDDRILLEYRSVLLRPKFNFAPAVIDELLTTIEYEAHLVVANPLTVPLPDADDLPFVEVAIAVGAPLVTGNVRHFPSSLHPNLNVVTPHDFLEQLKSSS